MTDGIPDGYALIWDNDLWNTFNNNANEINNNRGEYVRPSNVLAKMFNIVYGKKYIKENVISQDDGDFKWFKQRNMVYSDSSKSICSKYANLHLGFAYDVMKPIEYCELVDATNDVEYYWKPSLDEIENRPSLFQQMLEKGWDALEDAFSVIKNEKIFAIYNNATNEIEEFSIDNVEHYS